MMGRGISRRFFVAVIGLLALLVLVLPVRAEDAGEEIPLPEEFYEMLDALPDAVRESLPQSVLQGDAVQSAAALQRLLEPQTLLRELASLALRGGDGWLQLLAGVMGILLLRAVAGRLGDGLGGATLPAYALLCRAGFTVLLLERLLSTLQRTEEFFTALRALTDAYLPLMGTMYAMGGNVATAAVNQSTLVLATALVSRLGGQSVRPVFCICLALSLVGAISGEMGGRMELLGSRLKKWYASAISLTMLLLGAILAAQTTLAARADGLGFKTVRFVISNNIPIVGGSVAELLRTAAAQLSFLRSVVGIGGILLLLWLLLPVFFEVFLTRMLCTLASDAAIWLDCREEGRLLSELGSLYGYLLAIVSTSGTTFFLSLVVLLRCAVAYGA